jgi:hypothetical protein
MLLSEARFYLSCVQKKLSRQVIFILNSVNSRSSPSGSVYSRPSPRLCPCGVGTLSRSSCHSASAAITVCLLSPACNDVTVMLLLICSVTMSADQAASFLISHHLTPDQVTSLRFHANELITLLGHGPLTTSSQDIIRCKRFFTLLASPHPCH